VNKRREGGKEEGGRNETMAVAEGILHCMTIRDTAPFHLFIPPPFCWPYCIPYTLVNLISSLYLQVSRLCKTHLFRSAVQLLLPVVRESWDEYRQRAGRHIMDDEKAGMSKTALGLGRGR